MWKQKTVPGSTRNLSPTVLVARLGHRIAHLRKARRWTRRHLARRLDVSPKTVGNWEQGRCQPAFPLLVALAEHLEVSIDDLARSEQISELEA
jgi:transcriptional regulator with XRE-family HTH domain